MSYCDFSSARLAAGFGHRIALFRGTSAHLSCVDVSVHEGGVITVTEVYSGALLGYSASATGSHFL